MHTARHLLLLAAVLCGCLGAEYGWQPRKEFRFSVEGRNLAGMPQLKLQYAGFHFRGELRVQTHSPRVLLLKLSNMNYTNIHEELPEGWWKGPEPSRKNNTIKLPITTSTVVVKLSKSMSPELVVQSGLDDWQVNFIKGLVSNLLSYLGEDAAASASPNANRIFYSQQKETFSVFEESVVGHCQVVYEVSRLPRQLAAAGNRLCDQQQLWEITKTRNYSNCRQLSEDHANLPSRDCTPGGANCGRFWNRASLTQMVGCGEKNSFVLLSSVTSSMINTELHLQNNSQAVVNSNLNITLISATDLKKKFNPPQNTQSLKSMLYSYTAPTKDVYSRPCQNVENSFNENPANEMQPEEENINSQIGTGDENKNTNDNEESASKEGSSRPKRGIKKKHIKTYKTESNELQNENNENDNSYSSKKPSRDNNNYQSSFEQNSGKHSYQENSHETGNPYYQQKSSEETDDQPSEEMQLEEQWKISSKGMKKNPPHQPFNIFTLAHRNSDNLSCLRPKLRQIVTEIARDLEEINSIPEKNTMDKLSLAVDICRALPLDQLTAVGNDIYESHSGIMMQKERRVFSDVIAMCATHPALQLIKGLVEKHQLEGEVAAEIISSLPSHIYSPSKYLVQDFFEMVQQISEREDKQLTSTAVLALSNLVRQACVNPVTRQRRFSSIVKPVCDESFAAQYTEWLNHRLDADPQLYITALGNIASSDVIPILRDIAVSPQYSSFLQTSAVFAMRYLVLSKNPDMVPLLLSLYHNYSLPASSRIAAVALLVYSDPGLAVWQRLAISTWYEPSPAVNQFVASTIKTMASSLDSLYARVTKSAYQVQPLARPVRVSVHQPYNLLTSWLSSDLQTLVLEQLAWMQFDDFSNIYYRQTSRNSGFSRTNIEAKFAAGNFDELWSVMKELILSSEDNHRARAPSKSITHTLGRIQETLNISPRSIPELQAELSLKIDNIMERMLVVNKDTLRNWATSGHTMVMEGLSEGKSLSYQKADMNCLHISTTTELGFPVQFSLRTPWIITANADLNVTNDGVVLGAAFMYSSQLLSSVSVMSTWDNTAHSAGAYATNFIQLPPVETVISLDSAAEAIKLTTSYIDQHRLLYLSMQPFTSQRKLTVSQPTLSSPDTATVKLGDSIQMPIPWLSHYVNTVYSSEEKEHFYPMDFARNARGVVGFPLVMPSMEARSFETVMNPLHPIVMNFSMSTASKSMGLLELEEPEDRIFGKIFKASRKLNAFEQKSTSKDNSEEQQSRPNDVTNGGNQIQSEEKNYSSNKENGVIDSNVENYKVFATTYDSATGEFNASQIDPFVNSVNGSAESYLIEQILSKINSGEAVVFGLNMWSTHPDQPSKLSAYTAYATTYSKRATRLGLFVKNDNSQFKMTLAHETPVDIATNLRQRVTDDLHHNIFLDIVRLSSGQEGKAAVMASFGVSRGGLAQLRNSRMLSACSQEEPQHFDSAMNMKCQELQTQAREIGFGNITVYYNDYAKFIEKDAEKYISAAKVMLPRTEEKSGEGTNRIFVTFDVDQRTESIYSYITTPLSSIKIYRLPLSMVPMSTVMEWLMYKSAPKEFCGISTKRMRTFDGGQLTNKMQNNWHLLTQDCSGKHRFSVLAQPTNNNALMMEVNVNDHVVISVENGPKVYVNSKLQPLDTSHALLQITDRKGRVVAHTVFTPDYSLHMALPQDKLDLVYSNTSIIIRAGQGLQGRLCGLCGSYYNTGVEKFLTAQGSVAKSFKEFTASYTLKESESEYGEHNN